jgi:hypothetical protein
MDFRQIKASPEDFGLMTYDPAFMNTASCRSSIHDYPRADRLWVVANQADEVVVLDKTGKTVAKLGDFNGLDEQGVAARPSLSCGDDEDRRLPLCREPVG